MLPCPLCHFPKRLKITKANVNDRPSKKWEARETAENPKNNGSQVPWGGAQASVQQSCILRSEQGPLGWLASRPQATLLGSLGLCICFHSKSWPVWNSLNSSQLKELWESRKCPMLRGYFLIRWEYPKVNFLPSEFLFSYYKANNIPVLCCRSRCLSRNWETGKVGLIIKL